MNFVIIKKYNHPHGHIPLTRPFDQPITMNRFQTPTMNRFQALQVYDQTESQNKKIQDLQKEIAILREKNTELRHKVSDQRMNIIYLLCEVNNITGIPAHFWSPVPNTNCEKCIKFRDMYECECDSPNTLYECMYCSMTVYDCDDKSLYSACKIPLTISSGKDSNKKS